jgi:small-conductance mechanosensitive channel
MAFHSTTFRNLRNTLTSVINSEILPMINFRSMELIHGRNKCDEIFVELTLSQFEIENKSMESSKKFLIIF